VRAHGAHTLLEKLIEKLHHGPLLAHVENVTVSWEPATNEFKSFKINFAK
jgi:acylphosphatase